MIAFNFRILNLCYQSSFNLLTRFVGGVMFKFNRIVQLSLTVFIALIFVQCGSDPLEEAEKAFNKGDYSRAIVHYSEAKKQHPDRKSIDEKIAVSYMLHGQKLFQKTKNIKSFSKNFSRGAEFIPPEPAAEFKKKYSEILASLARAYLNTKPENDIQKEEFLNQAIDQLEEAIYQDPDNQQAIDMLDKIKSENFQKMLDKGRSFYKQAIREKNNDLFFSAEYYLKKARYFDPFSEESKKLLSKTRKKTLRVLDYRQDLAIAIVEQKWFKGTLLLDVEVENNTSNPVFVKAANFYITDTDGNRYELDGKMMKTLKVNVFKDQTVPVRKSVGGIIALKVAGKTDLEALHYRLDADKIFSKFFP